MKIAIVGCGKIADAHVEEIRKIPSVQLVAVCDLEPIMAEQLATRYVIPRWYCDVKRMLDMEKPDVLHIPTPPQSHLLLAQQAVAAGCHVFLEKPVAPCHCDAEATDPGQPLDELRVLIRGAHTSAHATFSAHARPIGHALRVYGTKNTAYVDFVTRTVVLECQQTFPSALGRLAPPFLVANDYLRQGLRNLNSFSHSRFGYFDGMRRLLTKFYLSIGRDLPPPIPYNEILRVSGMMERIFEQVYPEVYA